MNNSENFDETILAQVDNPSFGGYFNLRDWAVVRMIRIYQPVGFEAGAPMPLQGPDQLQVVDTRIS